MNKALKFLLEIRDGGRGCKFCDSFTLAEHDSACPLIASLKSLRNFNAYLRRSIEQENLNLTKLKNDLFKITDEFTKGKYVRGIMRVEGLLEAYGNALEVFTEKAPMGFDYDDR